MKNLIKYFLLLAIVPALLLTSCKDDDDPEPTQTDLEIMMDYMVQNDLDLPDVLNGWVKTGSAINVNTTDYSVPDYFVMDLRSASAFESGHIKDAVNVTLANVLDEAPNANGKPILMVCYSGQTAARATGALRMMGYEAYSLKWGMSAWHSDLAGPWNNNATDYSSPNWVMTGTPTPNGNFDLPDFNTGEATPELILENRVRAALNMSSWTIGKEDVLGNPGNYFVNNKWPLDSYNEYGHIQGCYRIDEDLNLQHLNYLDPDKTIVTYCYTGQTSSITNLWLNVLGYDGASLLFGVNGIAYSDLVVGTTGSAHKKSWKGDGSASELNFGYYDTDGNLIGPR